MQMNINDPTWVRLTPDGVELLRKWRQARGLEKDEFNHNGWYEFEMWTLMEIFGQGLVPGGPCPFEESTVFFTNPNP